MAIALPDLIDTLWNVKTISIFLFPGCDRDLIDTLWNVKVTFPRMPQTLRKGFNRYIVECKGKTKRGMAEAASRFNRYIVECKEMYPSGARF